jgi:amidohydrolase
MRDSIKNQILDLKNEMISLRRDFHRHPELGLEEKRTAQKIAEWLGDLGLEVATGIGRTGVVGLLKGKAPGKTVLLRADMDALPIKETNEVDYKSQNDGVMHACAHDGHLAILLIAAKVLNGLRDHFAGNIKFVFQPGEEGFAGAKYMIEDGALENPPVDAAFALHLMTHFPVGTVVISPGPTMACMDRFALDIHGTGAHAAMPEGGADAILMSAYVITALQSLISKEVSPTTPLVVHVGTVRGGDAFNIVAERVALEGTVRTLDQDLRQTVPDRMRRLCQGVTAGLRGTYRLDYQFGYPPVVNDFSMTELVKGIATQVVGPEQILDFKPTMSSDDMAFFLGEVPGCYFLVGAGNADKGLNQPHHSAGFDFDEEALMTGAEMMVHIALTYLMDD